MFDTFCIFVPNLSIIEDAFDNKQIFQVHNNLGHLCFGWLP